MNLLLRADASLRMGTGHTMRCLALAQAWQDAGGRAVFAALEIPSAILSRLQAEAVDVAAISADAGSAQDAEQTLAVAKEHEAEWIAVDGYQFGAGYQSSLKAAGVKVLFLDDYGHARPYSTDMVLNQNVSADEAAYSDRASYTRLLLGPKYALLRREFSGWREWAREIPAQCRRLLVTMGGSDPQNVTSRVTEALRLARLDVETTVIAGGSNPHSEHLQNVAAKSGLRVNVLRDAVNVAELMASADAAISAAGSTCWELCALGLPALLIDVSANQTPLAVELARRGCAVHVGSHDVAPEKIADALRRLGANQPLREEMSRRSRELVDGEGARRVVSALRNRAFVRLRQVRADDRQLLWEWANDPDVRAASFCQDPIPWEDHVAWFDKKLLQNGSRIFVAEDDDATPAGQIRFEQLPDGDWEIGISVAKAMRGRGLGGELIRLGVREMERKNPDARFHANVKQANVASVKAFEEASFERAGVEQVRGHAAIHFVCEKK
jgi:UDP-2,4-diacetamido-2,4,6-trideoxy-beta-L-altropyranose hydrolase